MAPQTGRGQQGLLTGWVQQEGKPLRVMRFVDEASQSISSLIVAEDSERAGQWFQELVTKHWPKLKIQWP